MSEAIVTLGMTEVEAHDVHHAISVTVQLLEQVGAQPGAALTPESVDRLVLVAQRLDHERRHHGAVPNPNWRDGDQLKPRRTHLSNTVWRLEGGTEDNDLWAINGNDGTVTSTWVPTDEQRQRIAAGENVDLVVWGGQPPVALRLSSTPIGARPAADDEVAA